MKAHIQWLEEKDGQIGVFRCGKEFNKFGDSYEIAGTVQKLLDGGLHISGVQSILKESLFKYFPAIRKLMKQEEIKYIIWERLRPDGTMKSIRINIKEK